MQSLYEVYLNSSSFFENNFLLRVQASDADIGINAQINYHLSSNPGEQFKIDSYNGNIYVKVKLFIMCMC